MKKIILKTEKYCFRKISNFIKENIFSFEKYFFIFQRKIVFSFTKLSRSFGSAFSYNIDEEKIRKIWHRQIVLVADKKNAILGGADKTVDNQCIFTDNSSIVDTCLNYLILDLTLFSQRKNIDVQKNISKMMSTKTDQLRSLLK